jgi:hypothetical protein
MSVMRFGLQWSLAIVVVTAKAQTLSLDALLPRIQHHVAEYVAGLPNYTCKETIHRYERPRRVKEFQTIDTIKLEIAVLNGTERFAWPGSTAFDDKDLKEIVGGGYGALTKGDFVIHARNIFLRDQAIFGQPKAEKVGDREAIRLNFEVPVTMSNFEVSADDQKAVVGYKGSVWADRDTLQLMRIDIEAKGIPRETHVRAAQSEINYATAHFGDMVVLLPSSAQHTLQHTSGVDMRTRVEFSGCRQYAASTSLSFEEAASPGRTVENGNADEVWVPPGIILPLRLTEPIDSATAAVGDAILATIARRVQAGQALTLPAGTIVRGRIRKMERHFDPLDYFVVGLEFNELEVEGRRIRFFGEADGDASSTVADWRQYPAIAMLSMSEQVRGMQKRIADSVPAIPGVAISVVTANRVRIAKGQIFNWKTKEPAAAAAAHR